MRAMIVALLLATASGSAAFLLIPRSAATAAQQVSPPRHAQEPKSRLYLSASQSADAAATGLLPPNIHSVLNITKPLHHGHFVWNEEGVPPGEVAVVVDLDMQLISVFRSGHEIGSSVVTFGAKSKDTPVGSFPILAKMQDHHSSTYDAAMPYTLRLTDDGVSIHGSDVRWGTATHGCIGVPNEFARLLFQQVHVGQWVTIKSSD